MTSRAERRRLRRAGVPLAVLLLAGCAGTSRLEQDRTGQSTGSAEAQRDAAGRALHAGLLPVPAEAQDAEVVRHVDGDTLVLRGSGPGPLAGTPTRVRLLQIDTPEVFGRQECWGPEAAARTSHLLPVGAPVRVQADVRLQDRYGRALLLLWDAQGRSVQEVLVAEGLARVQHVGPNDLALRELTRIEQSARRDRRGLWGSC